MGANYPGLGLPAFYVLVQRQERRVTLEWSDCDQKMRSSKSTSRYVVRGN